jgi:hypothetical protein
MAYEGLGPVKEFAGFCECYAAGDWSGAGGFEGSRPTYYKLVGMEHQRAHIASTVKRAIMAPISQFKVDKEIDATVERWCQTPRHVDNAILVDLEKFAERFFGKPGQTPTEKWHGRRDVTSYPIPATTACLEKKAKDGGTAAAILNSTFKDIRVAGLCAPIDLYGDLVGLDPPERPRINDPNIRKIDERAFDDWLSDDEVEEPEIPGGNLRWFTPEEVHRNTYEPILFARARVSATDWLAPFEPEATKVTAKELGQSCIRRTAAMTTPPKIRPIAVTELGGKVRGVSLHPAEQTHAMRILGDRMIASIKRKTTCKFAMSNMEFELRGLPDAKVLSADLSKASDNFQHSINAAVIRGCAKGQNWTDEERTAALNTLGKQELPDGRITSQASHMGYAGTWAILSCLNNYAASKASRDPRSYQTCGDDLVALWTEAQRQIYRTTIEELKLVYNEQKSYYGPNGRFCENFIETIMRDKKECVAKCHMITKIAEMVGARELNKQTAQPFGILTGLNVIRRTRDNIAAQAADHTLRRLEQELLLCPNVPPELGGSGRPTNRSSWAQVNCILHYLETGQKIQSTAKIGEKTRSYVQERMEKWEKAKSHSGKLAIPDLRVLTVTAAAHEQRLDMDFEFEPIYPIPTNTIRRQAKKFQKSQRSTVTVNTDVFRRTISRKIRNLSTLPQQLLGKPRLIRKLANQALRSERCYYLPTKLAAEAVQPFEALFTNQLDQPRNFLERTP